MLASYSCVQDTTADLAPVISEPNGGSGEVGTLQVSMPVSSRTALGDKVDGKYPVSWCESDVLAVNGKPTTGIAIYEETPNVAVFDLPLGITIPYHIVYPYQGEDVAVEANSGKYPVVFSAEQQHTEGTFAPNSAPMFAWSNGFEDIHMEHLAAALRFSIKAKEGQVVDLKYISVSTVDATPIAGTFDVYCTDKDDIVAGTLEARSNTYPTVFYNFENDSYKLSTDQESTFYIVVPNGEYERFEINFVEQSGKVYSRTFDATGDKKLLGGKVREFPSLVFDLEDCNNMLLIGTDVDMQTLANEVKAGTFNQNYDGALLISDIDMTDKTWESLNNFASLFEGRGYSIKGLTTPLFGMNVTGTISNVNVEGNIVETTNGKVGLVARSLAVDGDKVGTIFHCSATGSIEYKNSALAVSNDLSLINIGGVVGGVYGGKVSLAEATVDVTISAVAGEDGKTTEFTPCIGGVVGYACEYGENTPVVVENTSNGAINWDDQSQSIKAVPYIGGVAGYVTAGSFEGNVNTGALAISEPMDDLDWGGVIGASHVSVVNCENKGSLVIDETVTKANIGGVLGKLIAGSIENCENSGQLLFDDDFYIEGNCNIGGVVAYAESGTKAIAGCSNSGSITYLGSCRCLNRSSYRGNANVALGGVVGMTWSELVSECRNQKSAVLNIAGKLSGNGDILNNVVEISENTAIAGVIGVRAGRKAVLGIADDVKTENCHNEGDVTFKWQYCGAAYIFSSACIGIFESDYIKSCSNSGSVNVEANVSSDVVTHETTSTVTLFVSGMFGYISESCDNIHECLNSGLVKVSNSSSRVIRVSGLLGTAKNSTKNPVNIKFNKCGNTGNIIVNDDVKIRSLYVGGILSNTASIKLQYSNCYNSGSIESRANATGETYIGSIFGLSAGSDTGAGTEGITNSGRVTYAGNSALAYVGGYCGQYKENKHTVQFENASTGVVEYKGNASLAAFVGGVAGLGGSVAHNAGSNGGVITEISSFTYNTGGAFEKEMINNGNVTILGYAPKVYVSGGFGYIGTTGAGVSGLSNNGTVEVPDMSSAKNLPESIYMGGVFGYATMGTNYPTSVGSITKAKAISDCHNTGDIIYKGIATDGAYIGVVAGWTSKAALYDCTNKGKVISEGHAGNTCPLFNEASDNKIEKEYINDRPNMKTHDIAVGGIVGETDFDMSGCVNDGEVSHNCLPNPLRVDYLGELATSRFDVGGIAGRVFTPKTNASAYICSLSGLINNGDVTIYGVPSATHLTPSVDMASTGEYEWTDVNDFNRTNRRLFERLNVAGLVGRMMDLSKMPGSKAPSYFLSGCTNNGDVTVPEAKEAKCLNIAGGIADILVSHLECTSVHNTGRIAVEKAGLGLTDLSSKKKVHSFFINLGGIAATHFDYRLFANTTAVTKHKHSAIFNNCINEGDIHFGEEGASIYQMAGGILAQALHGAGNRCQPTGESDYPGGSTYVSQLQLEFKNCKNSGNIDYVSQALTITYNYNYAGGIFGSANVGHGGFDNYYGNTNVTIDHCENSGNIQWDRSNTASASNKDYKMTAVGGIVGHFTGGAGANIENTNNLATVENGCNATITSCKNSGRIYGLSGIMGGIIGWGAWYVTITGTKDDPTINTGDVAVVREGGKVVTRGRYGNKYTYAGGIAGLMQEYVDAKWAGPASSSYSPYNPEHQYCRIEHAVNEGAVGATGYAGGIAGYYWSAVEPSRYNNTTLTAQIAHRGGLQHCRNTGSIYALEQATTNVGSLVGMPRMFTYTASDLSDIAKYLSAGINADHQWPIGVLDCEVGGYVLRGATGEINVNESNYMNAIYGEPWDSANFITISDKGDYDGCTLYVAPTTEEPTPEPGV